MHAPSDKPLTASKRPVVTAHDRMTPAVARSNTGRRIGFKSFHFKRNAASKMRGGRSV
jgi:hypothetical protein